MIIDISDHTQYNFTRDVELDGETFRLVFNYNYLHDFWTLEIQDINNATLWIGKLVCNFDLLSRYQQSGMPKGRIIAETNDKNKEVVQQTDFQTKAVVLRYITKAEI